MEVLAALNRILIFGGDDSVEVVDCCDRIESLIEDPDFKSEDVPLPALADATKVLAVDGKSNIALAKALCGLLSACCVGDGTATKDYLLNECKVVEVIDGLLKEVTAVGNSSNQSQPILPTANVALTFHILDLVATLSYNSGDLRSALRPIVAHLPLVLSAILSSLCAVSKQNGLQLKYTRGTSPNVVDGVVVVSGVGGDLQRALKAHIDALFGLITTITLLCMGDMANGATLLRQDTFATIVSINRAFSTTPIPPPPSKKSTATPTPAAATPSPIDTSFPRQAFSVESRKMLLQWCEQALRNLTLAAVSHLASFSPQEPLPPTLEAGIAMVASSEKEGGMSPFGRMGDNVDLDSLKWSLQQTYRTASNAVMKRK